MGTKNPTVAALEHLTGPSRGTVGWLGDAALFAVLDKDRVLRLTDSPDEVGGISIAHIKRIGDFFEIRAVGNNRIWINGREVQDARLDNHDMIEFGESGPMSRFCLCGNNQPVDTSFPSILSDALAYLKNSRQALPKRVLNCSGLLFRRAFAKNSLVFRLLVTATLIGLSITAYQQWKIAKTLQERIASADLLLEEFARTLATSREEAVTPADIESLRMELGQRIETAADRLAVLEKKSRAAAEVIREKASSVFMIQAAYGLRDKGSGRYLRQVIGADGKPLVFPNGLLALSLEGDGPVAERQFIGTAFAVGDSGALITNRHAGRPWESDAILSTQLGQTLDPVLLKILAYQPGQEHPMSATMIAASEEDDLALLKIESRELAVRGLMLSKRESQPGEEIVVMGYPTGLRSLLAQAGREFIETLQASGDTDFWSIAERLAGAGKIVPLASRGIIGRVSEEVVVYDAETTHGGSGGPVFNMNGEVIAVNTAILPEYGGSNIGIPAPKVINFLNQVESQKIKSSEK